ncbi:hypothetical protein C9J85_08135 [Haloferax sp. wsp5]|nr:hypothetical protein C9J85_08135 [Haloferax sp. wsp5]
MRGGKRLVEKRADFNSQVYAHPDKHGISYGWDPFSVNGREILAGKVSPDRWAFRNSFLSTETLNHCMR